MRKKGGTQAECVCVRQDQKQNAVWKGKSDNFKSSCNVQTTILYIIIQKLNAA